MMKLKAIAFLLSLAIVPGSSQAGHDNVERILVPVGNFSPISGAHGSLWASSFLVRNHGADIITVHGVIRSFGAPGVILGPAETVIAKPSGGGYQPGGILRVASDQAKQLSFSLRVQDVSRQEQTWGTEIPVVRETDLDEHPLVLVGIPTTSGFRTTLRIYDIASRQQAVVRLRIFGIRPLDFQRSHIVPDELLVQVDLPLLTPAPGNSHSMPGYLEIGDIASLLPPHDYNLLALEISRVTPDVLPWAFVAIVNDETQHLTLITPQ